MTEEGFQDQPAAEAPGSPTAYGEARPQPANVDSRRLGAILTVSAELSGLIRGFTDALGQAEETIIADTLAFGEMAFFVVMQSGEVPTIMWLPKTGATDEWSDHIAGRPVYSEGPDIQLGLEGFAPSVMVTPTVVGETAVAA